APGARCAGRRVGRRARAVVRRSTARARRHAGRRRTDRRHAPIRRYCRRRHPHGAPRARGRLHRPAGAAARGKANRPRARGPTMTSTRSLRSTLALVVVLAATPARAQDVVTLTVDDAVTRALAHAPRLAEARARE